MSRFTTQMDGTLHGRFEPIEADLLRLATTQLLEMLDSGAGDPSLAASDGIFGRLLPDAYRDDDDAAAEFRRFTATDLLDRKAQNAQVVLNSLGSSEADTDTPDSSPDDDSDDLQPLTISLDPDAVQAWLRSLTDLRLTLADRLQITPDGVVHLLGDNTPFLRELYEWLGMLQEELVYTIDV
ncbi:DUF2017 family protein [Cryobacterium sp. N19]|uniref:DUF2017 family protein n=1 Tax=Cryobacterium sp. N19 TaxID=2048288 RepID=UPI001E59D246|nr:DUF2017 family protein [Cryobacterium sp. N19]